MKKTSQPFADKFYDGELGALYSREKTTFRVWSPSAESAEVLLYKDDKSECFSRMKMEKRGGIWSVEILGDLNGIYYTYAITHGGKTYDTIDIYARSAGANGRRGMVIDMKSTDPLGWENSAPITLSSPLDAVIYELHVRDFSADKNAAFINRGKFSAFCERGVKNSFGDIVGMEYIKSLGVTHIHLLPVFDFASVDEESPPAQFNWGYDPLNFNVPEGSYSQDPHNGFSRVIELKRLVLSAHEMGIGIIMDVVYNHTYTSEGSPFDRTLPGYYYRENADGTLSNGSGCGNEFASERKMARKFIVDSLCFWAREYKLDGFRFDLMGLLDIETINLCTEKLREINPSILLYGEGWTGGLSPLPENLRALKCNARSVPHVAMFSDDIRDAVKGSVFCDENCGYVNGDNQRREMIKSSLCGGVFHPDVNRPAEHCFTDIPLQSINYVEAHDNLTLFDKLSVSMKNASLDDIKSADRMAAAIVFFSQGIPFMQAGQEFLRSKPLGNGEFDHNSYRSPDEINCIKWNCISDNIDMVEYYRGLIAVRKSLHELHLSSGEEIRRSIRFLDFADGGAVMECGRILLLLNPSETRAEYTLSKEMLILCDEKAASPDGLYKLSGKIAVPPRSVMLLREV